jgi:5'-3' exonuclease
LIDGSNLLSRAFFATSLNKKEEELLQTKDGIFTNAVKPMIAKIIKLINEHKFTHMAVAWDVRRASSFRREIYGGYKASRDSKPKDPALEQQFQTMWDLLAEMNISQFRIDRFEADDIIGSLAHRWVTETEETECLMVSNDRDLYQILHERVSQITNDSKNGEIIYTLKDFVDEYSIDPKRWIDIKAILGDRGDDIPGITGVGEKAALPLIQMYGSLEEVYKALEENRLSGEFKRYFKKIAEGRDAAFLSKTLATIVTDIPEIAAIHLDELKININKDRMMSAFERLELRFS